MCRCRMWRNQMPTSPTSTAGAETDGPGAEPKSKPRSGSVTSRPIEAPGRRSMTGTSKLGFVLQDRDRHLLSELAILRVVDREMVRTIAGFGSIRRANARLLQLTRAGL